MAHYTSEYPPFYVAVDLVVLSVRSGQFCVLLIERGSSTYTGELALPGGFVRIDEDLEDAAYRELHEETGVARDHVVLEQLATYGHPERDPRGRVVSVAWMALGADFPEPTAGTDAAAAHWIPIDDLDANQVWLAFDHDQILRDGIERARAKLEYTGYAAALIPQPFTIGELHAVYEAVWGVDLDRANFQRKVLAMPGFLTEVEGKRVSTRGRPARQFNGEPDSHLSPPFLRN